MWLISLVKIFALVGSNQEVAWINHDYRPTVY